VNTPVARRKQQRLERVLGTPALFATAYGNVGSSIYYALGLTAAYALGLTPVVFVIAGVIFACTAATYAEGTVRYPEAGGSSSFARHAFNETVSFGAGWAQMLVYITTTATSAFFVPHYLSIFWEPLRTNPWDIVGGAVVIVVLVGINIVGIREAARLNVLLAVIDFSTQLLLVLLGFVLVFDPSILQANVHLGVAPTWGNLAIAVPVAMLAYTGIETISNLAEEARDPVRSVPSSIRLVAIAVFAIYFTLPSIALSAMPVEKVGGKYQTLLGLSPEHGGFQNDPVLGLVENMDIHGIFLTITRTYVGILAATILFIATNAGVIGASRITYAMSSYRQLPNAFRKLHPRFHTPWLTLLVFAGVAPILITLPGKTAFLGTLYAFGATLSFTVAHLSVIALRMRRRDEEVAYRARPNLRLRGIDWPLFALLGALGTGVSWVVIVFQNPATRWTGIGWLVFGGIFYYLYRHYVVREPLMRTVRAPVLLGPAMALEYRSVLVPVFSGPESREAIDVACRLAAERGASVAAVSVLELPLSLPLDAPIPEQEAKLNDLLDEAWTVGDSYGVKVVGRLARGRSAGAAIIEEAKHRNTEIVVMGAARHDQRRHSAIFGDTVDYVLKYAPCRVMVVSAPWMQ
jgi:APA family basic amino acid/polyamine antiporter